MASEFTLAKRMSAIQPSFIRDILKAADDPEVISFAGGLPNRDYFPGDALADHTARLMRDNPVQMLQYGQSEGELALREKIAERYWQNQQLNIDVEDILITNGSQQAIDLVSKVLLDVGDRVVIEAPGYLGAIQSLMFYQPEFLPVTINQEGMDLDGFAQALEQKPKLIYTVPNFQNPTGYSYSESTRQAMVEKIRHENCLLIEDDPYGEVRFKGEQPRSFYHYLPEQVVLMGSFSKVIAPGLRVGWIVAPKAIAKKLLVAKQAADLHTNRLSQHLILAYLNSGDYEPHLARLCLGYQHRSEWMGVSLDRLLGPHIQRTQPEGGMFLWIEFADAIDTVELFTEAANQGVVFVPAQPFYRDQQPRHAARLNFSSPDRQQIEAGVLRLSQAFERYV